MNSRRVRFTAIAQKQIRREKGWWLANRIHSDVFASDFDEALRVLALLPGIGTRYTGTPVPGVRRFYLRKIACHLYYTFDEHEVIVRAFWGARRREGPRIAQ